MRSLLCRALDIRPEELRVVSRVFVTLLLIVAGHTVLETVRDAIFLAKLPPNRLNIVYVALAALTFLATWVVSALARRFGRRNALIVNLVFAGYVTTIFYFVPATPAVALALYVFSGLVGAMLTPQFWLVAAQLFTVAEGRRLFGPIAAGGVLGAVGGAGGAALALRVWPVAALLPVAAGLFILTALWLTSVRLLDAPSTGDRTAPGPLVRVGARRLFADEPYLWRIAGLVAVSTAVVLVVDYAFKATAARAIPAAGLGEFFARYYAVVNGLSLVVQLFVSSRLIRRFGVVGAVTVMPFLLLGGGVAALLGGGLFVVILVLKGVDGGLRYSVHRVATELLYLPLSVDARERGKSVIDGVLARIAQAATATALYTLAVHSLATPRTLALVVVVLSAAWLALALGVRGAYLDLFRRALAAGHIGTESDLQELDLQSAAVLVEALSSPDPPTVIASMKVLERHGMTRLVPSLMLRHDDEAVIATALDLFVASDRNDWTPLGARLLEHPSESVRIAAVRALARGGRVDALEKAISDPSARVQAYAAFHLAVRESGDDLLSLPLIATIMQLPGAVGRDRRRGLLAAASDAPTERAISLLIAFAERPDLDDDVEATKQLAHAIAALKSLRLVPVAIARHAKRAGRDAMRDALVAIGEPALDALARVLGDEDAARRVRIQVPQTIAQFGSQHAADVLVAALERETNGLVRYKALRALGRLVGSTDVRIDRVRIERMVRRNLEEYLRLLALRLILGGPERSPPADASSLLTGLLDDKRDQALERAFRLLKIAHKREDIHRVHTAALSHDVRERANAGEFLDALLARRDQQALRELLRAVVDVSSGREQLDRAAPLLGVHPRTSSEVLALLIDDRDDTVAALAALEALTLGDPSLREAVDRARRLRPSLEAMSDRLWASPPDDARSGAGPPVAQDAESGGHA